MKLHVIFLAIAISSIACNPFSPKTTEKIIIVKSDSLIGTVVADTIIYDVMINPVSPDDVWEMERLKSLDHKLLIDSLFQLVYSKEVEAFDFFTNKKVSPGDLKKMEEEAFDRNQIGKIQFVEKWRIDMQTHHFTKEVISIVLGYETYDTDGSIRGYKPIFKINLNN